MSILDMCEDRVDWLRTNLHDRACRLFYLFSKVCCVSLFLVLKILDVQCNIWFNDITR